jgi:hypothetical protein
MRRETGFAIGLKLRHLPKNSPQSTPGSLTKLKMVSKKSAMQGSQSGLARIVGLSVFGSDEIWYSDPDLLLPPHCHL